MTLNEIFLNMALVLTTKHQVEGKIEPDYIIYWAEEHSKFCYAVWSTNKGTQPQLALEGHIETEEVIKELFEYLPKDDRDKLTAYLLGRT